MLVGRQLSGSCVVLLARAVLSPNKSIESAASKPTAISTFMLP